MLIEIHILQYLCSNQCINLFFYGFSVFRASGFKSTYKEIDTELVKLEDNQKFGNSKIDLSLLTSRLLPEKDCKEADEVWTMEMLYDNLMNFVNT